jgi:hypothetical protein
MANVNLWSECSKDEDCVEIDFYCAGGIVNKKFQKEAHQYYSDKNKVLDCMRKDPTEEEKKIPYKLFCEKKKCNKQGFNKVKPGFS